MTAKRFINDAYTIEFTANITQLSAQDNHYIAILDQTYFYPEGGGQPADIGIIAGHKVLDVQYNGDTIQHVLAGKPEQFENIPCKIDWDHRFDLMQQHSGQHILSSSFEKLFDANTVGFHLSETYVTIDLDQKLSEVDVLSAENLTNSVVFNNLPIHVHYPNEKELSEMPLRKPPKVTKDIRVIEIDKFDFSPCGGTHVQSTGEIGMIKIKKVENHKSGIRVEFICGNRALKDYQMKNQMIYTLATDFSVKPEEVMDAYDKLKGELSDIKKSKKNLIEQLTDFKIKSMTDSAEKLGDINLICQTLEDLDMRTLKKISATLVNTPSTIALLALKEKDVKLLFARSKDVNVSMKDIIQDSLEIIGGRGGGSPAAAQGGGNYPEKSRESLEIARQKVISLLN